MLQFLKGTGVDFVTVFIIILAVTQHIHLTVSFLLQDLFSFQKWNKSYDFKSSVVCQSFMTTRYVPLGFCSLNCTGDNPPSELFGLSLL